MPLLNQEIKLLSNRQQTPKEFHLVDRSLYDNDIALLVDLLIDNPSVETLNLRYNNITDKGAALLSRLEHVKKLALSYNNINQGVLNLIENIHIQYLYLDCNNIKPETALKVTNKMLGHLLFLDLSNNYLEQNLLQKIENKMRVDREKFFRDLLIPKDREE